VSNVHAGAELAASRDPELVVFDGSGAAIPPIATDRRILVAGAHQPPELVTGYLNAYRILVSDLVILTMAEENARHEELQAAIGEVKDVPVIPTVLRPRPVADVSGRRVAFFTTAPESALARIRAHLREEHGAELAHVSGNLARRDALREELETVDADVFLVEIKAAAIDVVAEAASERGVEVVFADNEVLPVSGGVDLDAELRRLAAEAVGEPALR
jgi:cyclic 2,3-diphosphoglycerate synthetase